MDLHRRDVVDRFLPAVVAVPNPVVREALLVHLAHLSSVPFLALLTAAHRAEPVEDEEAVEVLWTLRQGIPS